MSIDDVKRGRGGGGCMEEENICPNISKAATTIHPATDTIVDRASPLKSNVRFVVFILSGFCFYYCHILGHIRELQGM